MSWFEDRRVLERRWKAWTGRLRVRGVDLRVTIPLAIHWPSIETRLPFRYDDRQGSSVDIVIARVLLRLEEKQLLKLAKKTAARLPLGRCDVCAARALLTRYKRRPQCHRCMRKAIDAWAAKDEAERRELMAAERARLKARGYRYLLDLWIHPRNGGDDRLLRKAFKTRPSIAAIRAIARRRRSALLGDFRVTTL